MAYGLLGLAFLAIGSLLNVIIYRLPLMIEAEWRLQCQQALTLPTDDKKKINLFFPRSFCPQCNHLIAWWYNLPLISYCLLRGRCRYCQESISWRYPLVEASCLLLSLYAVFHFGLGIELLWALPFLWIIIVLFFIDLQHQLLPDALTLSLLWLGLLANSMGLFTPLAQGVYAAVGAYLLLWGLMKLFYLLTGKIGMGHGDFKLLAALGAWFGPLYLPFILLLSSLTGLIIGLLYLKTSKKSKDTPIPFGPFLCISGLIILFWGPSLLFFYQRL